MTAELYRGRSKTSSFQFEGEMVSGFNAGNRIGTGKRASSDRPIDSDKPTYRAFSLNKELIGGTLVASLSAHQFLQFLGVSSTLQRDLGSCSV
jgi:hypothetical protein